MVSKSCFEFYLLGELEEKSPKGGLLFTSRERLHDMRYTLSLFQNMIDALLNTLFYQELLANQQMHCQYVLPH